VLDPSLLASKEYAITISKKNTDSDELEQLSVFPVGGVDLMSQVCWKCVL